MTTGLNNQRTGGSSRSYPPCAHIFADRSYNFRNSLIGDVRLSAMLPEALLHHTCKTQYSLEDEENETPRVTSNLSRLLADVWSSPLDKDRDTNICICVFRENNETTGRIGEGGKLERHRAVVELAGTHLSWVSEI